MFQIKQKLVRSVVKCVRAHARMCVFVIVFLYVCMFVRVHARSPVRVCVAVYVCSDDGDSIS